MLKEVKCSECGTKHTVNTKKHVFRPKYCTICRAIIDNINPKRRILSVFQKNKQKRKEATRQRFVDRMRVLGHGFDYISKKITKVFKWESKE